MTSSVKAAGCGLVNRTRSRPVDVAAGAQQLGEGLPVAELDAVGVHVLAQQGDLDGTVVDERLDLGQDLAGAAVLFLAAQGRDDAEGAGVVAAHGDRYPARVDGVALGGQGGGKDVERFEDLQLGLIVVAGPVQQRRQGTDIVGAEHGIHPRGFLEDGLAVLLRETAADGDLHARVGFLDRGEDAEVAVQLVVGVFPDRAGVEDHDVGQLAGGGDVACGFQHAGHPLGIVHVHLAAEGAHLVGAGFRLLLDGRGGDSQTHLTRVRPATGRATICSRSGFSTNCSPDGSSRPSTVSHTGTRCSRVPNRPGSGRLFASRRRRRPSCYRAGPAECRTRRWRGWWR